MGPSDARLRVTRFRTDLGPSSSRELAPRIVFGVSSRVLFLLVFLKVQDAGRYLFVHK